MIQAFFGFAPLQFWEKICRRNYRGCSISLLPTPFSLYSLSLSSKFLCICFWNWGHWIGEPCLHSILHPLIPNCFYPRGFHTDIQILSMVNFHCDQKRCNSVVFILLYIVCKVSFEMTDSDLYLHIPMLKVFASFPSSRAFELTRVWGNEVAKGKGWRCCAWEGLWFWREWGAEGADRPRCSLSGSGKTPWHELLAAGSVCLRCAGAVLLTVT